MQIKKLKLEGSFEITLKRLGDERGYFMRSYDQNIFAENGLQTNWVQENQSYSTRIHTIRGLHFQKPPFTETKLIRVIKGAILDAFVDLRKNSPTFGQWDSIELSGDADNYVYIPKGFAHGFCTLTQETIVQYKVDSAYSAANEDGIRWNDPAIGIDWQTEHPFLSERDQNMQLLADFDSPF